MDRLHDEIQGDGIRLLFGGNFHRAFRLVTSQVSYPEEVSCD